MREELHYRIALTFIPQIGDVMAKNLLELLGSASAIFSAKRRDLEQVPGVGIHRAAAIKSFKDHAAVERELKFLASSGTRAVFYTDDDYPKRLRHCYDSPVMLYAKGAGALHADKMLAVVGTRRPTAYGQEICRAFVEGLSLHHVTIVSGLAYGIDITAHRAALEHNMATIGVLAHGLDKLYPAVHKSVAEKMLDHGGLLTDFPSQAELNRQNFPQRNRIVAGMCDAVLVVESGEKGGSLITADIAAGYNRDVMAVPGRIGDAGSAGCLDLIKQNKGALVTCVEDVLDNLNWRAVPKPAAAPPPQTRLFHDLEPLQQQIMHILTEHSQLCIDELQYRSGIPQSGIAGEMLKLELMGLVRALPGHTYQLINT